jgi:hypothetical protein
MSAPQPPAHAVTPFVPQLELTILCVTGAVLLIAYAIRRWRRTGSPVMLLLIAGATVASLQEAPLDIFVSAYYPHAHLWTVYETFGRPVPVWAPFAWMALFAGAPYLLADAMRRGSVRKAAGVGILCLAVVNIVIELPAQATHQYFYYGNQPLKIGGFPMSMVAVNASTMVAIAVAVYLGEDRLRGRMRLLALVVPGLAVPASTMTTGLPVWSAVGARWPTGLLYVAALATFALSFAAIDGMLALAERFGATAEARGMDRLPFTRDQTCVRLAANPSPPQTATASTRRSWE